MEEGAEGGGAWLPYGGRRIQDAVLLPGRGCL